MTEQHRPDHLAPIETALGEPPAALQAVREGEPIALGHRHPRRSCRAADGRRDGERPDAERMTHSTASATAGRPIDHPFTDARLGDGVVPGVGAYRHSSVPSRRVEDGSAVFFDLGDFASAAHCFSNCPD